jgi:hypothetical protein
MSRDVFLIHRDGSPALATPTLAEAQDVVDGKLWETDGEPDTWRTEDGYTVVERYDWVPVGAYAEDLEGVGVRVVLARLGQVA